MTGKLSIRGCCVERRDGKSRRFSLLLDRLDCSTDAPIAVVGPSGSGKSTLLEVLALVRTPSQVERFSIVGDGPNAQNSYDVRSLWHVHSEGNLSRLRARYIGYAPQRGGYFPALSSRSNAMMRAGFAGISRSVARSNIREIAHTLELTDRELDALPDRLSTGQKQRVTLLQAIVHNPRLIVVDEPTSALHPTLAEAVLAALRNHARQTGAQIIVATHEIDLARKLGFRLMHATAASSGAVLQTRFAVE